MIQLTQMGECAVAAKYVLQTLSADKKNQALEMAADNLCRHAQDIINENKKDMEKGKQQGMHPGMLDRLMLTEERIAQMADGLRELTGLPDPVGTVLEKWERPNGLQLKKVSVPMGVIGIIYESRPNVTADAFGLCFKSGNAVILKGGSDALHSNLAITDCIRKALTECKIPADAIQLIADTDRETTKAFMKMKQYIDVLIPRGSAGLIQAAVAESTIPIIETGTGNCHIFVDESADFETAAKIVCNAKTQRIGVCNACESLVVHEKIADQFLPVLKKELNQIHSVELRGDRETCEILDGCIPALEEDYGKEYLDYILSVKTVSSVEEAIAHINRYSTHHSEAILTKNHEHAEKFLNLVDSACVYVNSSTRFTDGFEFGFGAEIGISTQKLHARGPMGLKELTTYKYQILGDGQIR